MLNLRTLISRAGKAGEGGGHELKELDRDREANVVTAAIAALAAAAGALAWPHYQQLLGRFMRIMGRDASKARPIPCALLASQARNGAEGLGLRGTPRGVHTRVYSSWSACVLSCTLRPVCPDDRTAGVTVLKSHAYHCAAVLQAVIRAVCAIIDAFHFPLPADAASAAAPDSEQAHPVPALEVDAPAAPAAAGAGPDADADLELAREIQGALVKRVLPALQAQLVRPRASPALFSMLSPPNSTF